MPTVLKLNGVEVDRRAARIGLGRWTAYARGSYPTLTFWRRAQDLTALPYVGEGDVVDLEVDSVHVFRGDVRTCVPRKTGRRRWRLDYNCEGLRARGDRFPMTEELDGTDRATYNRPSTDSLWLPSRAGRQVGQVVASVLEMPTNRSNLAAAGLGNLKPGGGAEAHATLSGYGVAGVVVDDGWGGYDPFDPPRVLLVGGGGSGAEAEATIVDGAVVSISVTSPGSGYLYPPRVVVTTLPEPTVRDLLTMTMVPAGVASVGGERFLQAIENYVQNWYPNRFLHVEPDGTLRFLDQRHFAGPEVRVEGTGAGALIRAVVDPADGSIASVEVLDGGVGYGGGTTATVVGGGGGGAVVSVSVEGGAVVAAAVEEPGNGYHFGSTLRLWHGRHPIEAPSLTRSWSDGFARVLVRGHQYVEGALLRLGAGDLEEAFEHDGLDNEEAKAAYDPREALTPGLGPGACRARAVMAKAAVASVEVLDGGSGFTSAPTIEWNGGGGTSLSLSATVSGGRVTGVAVTSSSGDFTTEPTLFIKNDANGGGWGARFRARLAARAVASIQVDSGGYGHAAPPPVKIKGGGGSGAVAGTPTVSGGAVTAIPLTSGGSGYTAAPRVLVGAPKGAAHDSGSVEAYTDFATLTLRSDDETKGHAAGHWDWTSSGRRGVILLWQTVAEGIERSFQARVIADTGLSPGGTTSVTIDPPVPHQNFDRYELYGQAGGSSVVYTRYRVTDEAIARSLSNERFTFGFPFHSVPNVAAVETWYNAAALLYSDSGEPPYMHGPAEFQIDPDNGYIHFARPVYTAFGNRSRLLQGQLEGVPDDIAVVVGVNKKSLRAAWPPDDEEGAPTYAGTLHDLLGNRDTLTITAPSWRDRFTTGQMVEWAKEWHAAVCDVHVDGLVTWLGSAFAPALAPGLALSFVGYNGEPYDLGMGELAVPVVRAEVEWDTQGDAVPVSVTMSFSNRRYALSAPAFTAEPSRGEPIGMAQGGLLDMAWYAAPNVAGEPGAAGSAPGASVPTAETPWATAPLAAAPAARTPQAPASSGASPPVAAWPAPDGVGGRHGRLGARGRILADRAARARAGRAADADVAAAMAAAGVPPELLDVMVNGQAPPVVGPPAPPPRRRRRRRGSRMG